MVDIVLSWGKLLEERFLDCYQYYLVFFCIFTK